LTALFRCSWCGGDVVRRRGVVAEWTYRKGGRLVKGMVPTDLLLATCLSCGEFYTSPEDCLAIDRALGADE
jgi:hypothetical protein